MTMSVVKERSGLDNDRDVAYGYLVFDSSYPTGGEAYSEVSEFGLSQIDELYIWPSAGYTFEHDAGNLKIIAYDGATQVANTTDLSALTNVRYKAVGRA